MIMIVEGCLPDNNTIYPVSLCWFINLFCTSIDASDKSEELEERLMNIKEHFIKSLFFNTSAGMLLIRIHFL